MYDAIYDEIGVNYANLRRPDPRWAAQIHAALPRGARVLNVGAGSGSYEPEDNVVALEPSWTMIRQRPDNAAPVVAAIAEALPFKDGAFDVSLAILTLHHWHETLAGLAEMQRVSRRQVIVTWDPVVMSDLWLVQEYLPEILKREQDLPTLDTTLRALPDARVEPLLVPHDASDGFLGAWWRRPQAYLDARVRAAISGLALLDQRVVDRAMEKLQADLNAGRWHQTHKHLLGRESIDLGYRLVVSDPVWATRR